MLHFVVGVDVEHVDGAPMVQKLVEENGCCAAGEVQYGAVSEMLAGQGRGAEFFDVGEAGGQAYGYEQDVPQVGVDRQEWGFIVQAACVGKNGDAAEEAVVHQEREQSLAGAGGAEPGEDQEDVHGYAAELEWEIPPLVDTVVLAEGEVPLFPELAGRHEDAAN